MILELNVSRAVVGFNLGIQYVQSQSAPENVQHRCFLVGLSLQSQRKESNLLVFQTNAHV